MRGRKRRDAELARDLEFYLQAEIEDNLARGMSPEEARAAARRKLGNATLVREEVYRMNTAAFVESTLQDLRLTARSLGKHPVFALTAMLTLALGIGGNTAMFTVVRAVLLKPLEYHDPDRLMKIGQSEKGKENPVTIGYATAHDLRARNRTFESLSLFRDATGAILVDGRPDVIQGLRVNYDYFATLGVGLQLGRTFLPEEDRPDRRFEAILTHGAWTRRFGGDRGIVGRSIRLSDTAYTVVGVLPREFRPLTRAGSSNLPEIYMPLGYDLSQPFACRSCQHLQLIGRLKKGVTPEQARADLNGIMRDLIRQYPAEYRDTDIAALMPLREYLVGSVSKPMWIVLGAVGFVLLMACANVANLVLARATGRTREMAVRAAIGAGRGRLVRQMMCESLVLAFGGGAAGLLLAWRGTAALAALGPSQLPRAGEIRVDSAVLGFTFAACVITAVLFGLLPAWRASRVELTQALKESGRSTAGRGGNRLRDILAAAELALAFVLVMGAGLLGKSFLRLTAVDPGYNPQNVLTAATYLYGPRYRNPDAVVNYFRDVVERVSRVPGVSGAALVSTLPLAGFDRRGFHIQDRPLESAALAPSVEFYSISPEYFRVMRIPLKRGRTFTEQDRGGAPKVAVISESCARAQFPDRDAIGRHVQFGGRSEKQDWYTIVGIVGDIRQSGLDSAPGQQMYTALAQESSFGYNLVARTSGEPASVSSAVRDAFLAADSTQPVYQMQPLESYLDGTLATRKFTMLLLVAFGALALCLATVGIYGVISYSVSMRTREVGIRMAMGAANRDVLWMVLRQAAGMIAAGLLAGTASSILLTRFLNSLLYEVRPMDPATSVLVALGLSLVALGAGCIPAMRAMRVDPVTALREG